MNQIGAGITKGYPEHDIVMAVTLSKVKQIMRAHFKETSSTELYQFLVNMAQLPDEDLQEFSMRALNIRQGILTDAEDEITYISAMVQGIFFRTLETGQREDNIITTLRPLFHSTSVDDAELIKTINKLSHLNKSIDKSLWR